MKKERENEKEKKTDGKYWRSQPMHWQTTNMRNAHFIQKMTKYQINLRKTFNDEEKKKNHVPYQDHGRISRMLHSRNFTNLFVMNNKLDSWYRHASCFKHNLIVFFYNFYYIGENEMHPAPFSVISWHVRCCLAGNFMCISLTVQRHNVINKSVPQLV